MSNNQAPLMGVTNERPIAVMSFNRPHYLEAVLNSLKLQNKTISPNRIFLFQDGYRIRNGQAITNPNLIERCVDLFESSFPSARTHLSIDNIGVAQNFARAEAYMFDELGAEAAYFFEDDLVLSKHYITALDRLTDWALKEDKIAYVAAYGDHRANLAQQKLHSTKMVPMSHKWGFGLTRRQWMAQREIIAPYLEIVARDNYRNRDNNAIHKYFRHLGYGSPGTSQDSMKDIASCILGTTKVMTFACFGKYIGEIGLHSNKTLYDHNKFAETEIYPDMPAEFKTPAPEEIDAWISAKRAESKKALELIQTIDEGTNSPLPNIMAKSVDSGIEKSGSKHDNSVISVEALTQALYRVLLFRDVDPVGLRSAITQLKNGQSIEDLIKWCLCSEEFASKFPRFVRSYINSRFLNQINSVESEQDKRIQT